MLVRLSGENHEPFYRSDDTTYAAPARPRHAFCWRARDDSNARTLPLELHAGPNRAISSPLPGGTVSFIEVGQAPVTQLDRALPSEADRKLERLLNKSL